jgi:predicted transcriptional regulator
MSVWAVLFEELTYHKYRRKRDVLRMVYTSFLEPFFYHPLNMILAIKANFDYFSGKRSWGQMERKGFYTRVKGKRKVKFILKSRGKEK